jgi:hypothetical protein
MPSSARAILDALAGHGASVVDDGDRMQLVRPTAKPCRPI